MDGRTPGRLSADAAEEIAHLREEARGLRVGLAGGLALELLQQLALAARQALRGLDHHGDIHVALVARSQHRHAEAAQAELLARLRSLGHPDLVLLAGN